MRLEERVRRDRLLHQIGHESLEALPQAAFVFAFLPLVVLGQGGVRDLVPEPPSTYYYGRIYGCFTADHHGLHSLPARFGVAAALRTARVCHALTALAFALVGVMLTLGPLYWLGWLAVVGLLVYEHSLVSPTDLSRLDVAFFNVNGYIAVIVLASVIGGLW